jgi:cell division protein FtsZ
MSEMGQALMGSATCSGETKAMEAASRARSSPLLEDISISGARGVLINITGSSDMTLHDVNEASSLVHEEAHDDAHIIFGAVIDESMGEKVRVTVIATGFGKAAEEKIRRSSVAPAVIVENLDVPTKIRREKEKALDMRKGELQRVGKLGGFNGTDEDLYDTPTFLRKQAD